MTKNKIREFRLERKMSQTELSAQMPGNPGKVILSLIENGHVLPTADALRSICSVFQCRPEDLYEPDALDLSCAHQYNAREGSFVIRLSDSEWKVLEDGITLRFYKNKEEWFRESLRQLQKDCTSIRQCNQVI